MRIVKTPAEMQCITREIRKSGKSIGFVPTMGALHAGHTSLMDAASSECDIAVASIFVNPTQFGAGEDFDKYPRNFDNDIKIAEKSGIEIIYAPTSKSMYPQNFMTMVQVSNLPSSMEGKLRPTHFNGVTTVVLKLFNAVLPDIAYFGQKDAQQAIILKRMVADLDMPLSLSIKPTVRDTSGLALSSRNIFLTNDELKDAPLLFMGLLEAEIRYENGEYDSNKIRDALFEVYNKLNFLKIEYLEIVDSDLLVPIKKLGESTLIAVAAKTVQSKIHLIDNIMLGKSL